VDATPDPVDPRFGPALSWVSYDGGNAWIPVPSEELGERGADISATAVATLDGKVVAIGSDGADLAVWIGTWEQSQLEQTTLELLEGAGAPTSSWTRREL